MEFKLRISTWGKEIGLQLGKMMNHINKIMQEKDFIFYEINYKPSECVIVVSANLDLKELISEIVPEGWNYTYEYLGKYAADFYDEDLED